uniref:Uncharacterized protein n=1 Tax=viral metagenome TaxID=1070528 RepID=A0A6M3KVJ8_9ZZZZ
MLEKRKDRVLAEGEATGHAHVATSLDVEIFGMGEQREMVAPNGTEVQHEEHKTVSIPAGTHNIRRQQEIDPDTQEIQSLRD